MTGKSICVDQVWTEEFITFCRPKTDREVLLRRSPRSSQTEVFRFFDIGRPEQAPHFPIQRFSSTSPFFIQYGIGSFAYIIPQIDDFTQLVSENIIDNHVRLFVRLGIVLDVATHKGCTQPCHR